LWNSALTTPIIIIIIIIIIKHARYLMRAKVCLVILLSGLFCPQAVFILGLAVLACAEEKKEFIVRSVLSSGGVYPWPGSPGLRRGEEGGTAELSPS
jgi:hypothetical protein